MRHMLVVLVIGLMALGASAGGSAAVGGGGGSQAGSAGSATEALISVIGKAGKGSTVRYANDTFSYAGRVPLHTSLYLDERNGFYVVFVRLKHGGNVTCKVIIGSARAVGHARGGHKSCLAKLKNRYDGTWYPSKN